MTRRLHNYLYNKHAWYCAWHRFPYHPHIHWGITGVATGYVATKALALLATASIVVTPFISNQPVYASAKSWSSQSDFNSWQFSNSIFFTNPNGSISLTGTEGTATSNSLISLPNGQERIATAAIYAPNVDKTYIFGGYNPLNPPNAGFDEIYTLDYNDQDNPRLTKLNATLPHKSTYMGAVWSSIDNKIYLFGGKDGDSYWGTGIYYNDILQFDPVTETLTDLCGTQNVCMPTTIASPSVAWDSINQVAYILGGYSSDTENLDSIVKFDPSSLEISTKNETLPYTSYQAIAFYYPPNQKIYLLGGGDGTNNQSNPYSTDAILEYNPDSGAITNLCTTTAICLSDRRESLGGALVPELESVYTLGGAINPEALPFASQIDILNVFNMNLSTDQLQGLQRIASSVVWDIQKKKLYQIFGWTAFTSGSIQVFDLDISYQSSGYAYKNVDASAISAWNTLTKAETLNGQTIDYYAKPSSDTTCSDPGGSWTGWTQLTFSGNDADLSALSPTRYLCLGVNLSTTDATVTPQVDSLTLAYTNLATTLTAPNGSETLTVGTPATISWSATSASSADHIHLQYSTDSGASWTDIASDITPTDTSYSWTPPDGLESSTVRIKVILEDASSAELASDSSDADFSVAVTTPTPTPTNTSPTISSISSPADSATLTTNQPSFSFTPADADSADTLKYQIQIAQSNDFASPAIDYTSALATPAEQTFTVGQSAGDGTYTTGEADQTLADATYYWRVRAIDNSGATSDYSATRSFAIQTVYCPTDKPSVPSNFSAKAISTGIYLAWVNPADSNLTHINIYRSEVASSRGLQIATTSDATSTNYTDTTASSGTTYYYSLTATNSKDCESDATAQIKVNAGFKGASIEPIPKGRLKISTNNLQAVKNQDVLQLSDFVGLQDTGKEALGAVLVRQNKLQFSIIYPDATMLKPSQVTLLESPPSDVDKVKWQARRITAQALDTTWRVAYVDKNELWMAFSDDSLGKTWNRKIKIASGISDSWSVYLDPAGENTIYALGQNNRKILKFSSPDGVEWQKSTLLQADRNIAGFDVVSASAGDTIVYTLGGVSNQGGTLAWLGNLFADKSWSVHILGTDGKDEEVFTSQLSVPASAVKDPNGKIRIAVWDGAREGGVILLTQTATGWQKSDIIYPNAGSLAFLGGAPLQMYVGANNSLNIIWSTPNTDGQNIIWSQLSGKEVLYKALRAKSYQIAPKLARLGDRLVYILGNQGYLMQN